MTQLEWARQGIVTPQMEAAAQREGLAAEDLRIKIAAGTVVLPANKNHPHLTPIAVGKGLTTKVNANIGTSEAYPHLAPELAKLEAALKAGAHAIMDLSTGGDIDRIRQEIIESCAVMVGTVPLYQVMVEAQRQNRNMGEITSDDFFAGVRKHCQDGADFITVHCGVTREVVALLRAEGRLMDIVSRGGAFLARWMLHNNRQNPLFAEFDRLLEIAREYDVVLSLGDGLRPGCLADATDAAQLAELVNLGALVKRARAAGVQVMVEGPGHVPLDQVESNVKLAKTICHDAPFYVLGPLVTDIAPGYDHITAAIGGALAAFHGADFLCYVTPAEHLGLPDIDDVRTGVMSSRIAAHAADVAKGIKGARAWDDKMAKARKALDWEAQLSLAIDSETATRFRHEKNERQEECCTMCGQFCAYK
ncbi:MAG: phosphomethylpyrimidine synthase ThiC [Peptococcaceae bacterium]|nr:phosphomethylpyrimidine synthase ThiC [Peptococcaceae bacterium]